MELNRAVRSLGDELDSIADEDVCGIGVNGGGGGGGGCGVNEAER